MLHSIGVERRDGNPTSWYKFEFHLRINGGSTKHLAHHAASLSALVAPCPSPHHIRGRFIHPAVKPSRSSTHFFPNFRNFGCSGLHLRFLNNKPLLKHSHIVFRFWLVWFLLTGIPLCRCCGFSGVFTFLFASIELFPGPVHATFLLHGTADRDR